MHRRVLAILPRQADADVDRLDGSVPRGFFGEQHRAVEAAGEQYRQSASSKISHLPMYSVTKRIEFCYGHRLLDYDGICKHPHGHNAVAEIEVRTDQLDNRNMVCDFSDIKRIVKGWIDRELDHRWCCGTTIRWSRRCSSSASRCICSTAIRRSSASRS